MRGFVGIDTLGSNAGSGVVAAGGVTTVGNGFIPGINSSTGKAPIIGVPSGLNKEVSVSDIILLALSSAACRLNSAGVGGTGVVWKKSKSAGGKTRGVPRGKLSRGLGIWKSVSDATVGVVTCGVIPAAAKLALTSSIFICGTSTV